jgi:beta-glucosidase
MIQFPKDFLWGAATSAYQVEGNNVNSDWWPWEKQAGKEQSAEACRHYELYNQDFDIAQGLNHNAHRLSIEWARIEPQEGQFSESELQHYIDVLQALRTRQIEPIVTLHHFTNPIWFSASGGWLNKQAVARFIRYCDVVTKALGPYVRYWITINEPTILFSHAYIFGAWPPQEKSFWKARQVRNQLMDAHIETYRLIHKNYKELNLSKPAVSFSQHVQAIVPCTDSLKNRVAAHLRNQWYNLGLLDKAISHQTLDFIGINYYSRQLVGLKRWGIGNVVWDVCSKNHHPLKKNSLGWDIYPEGLQMVLLKLKKYNLPIMITENGICTNDDQARWKFLYDHLKNIHAAMEQGVQVTGYLYWSLMDNFEWDKGYAPRFGLIDIDYGTFKRTVRESARKFAEVCKTGILETS